MTSDAAAKPGRGAVHATAVSGYSQGADAYARSRPGYAPAVLDAVAAALDLRPGRHVLEVGAGTGKFTAELVRTGARVVAVEPVPAMREKLTDTAPAAEVLDGSAELLPLPNGSVDAAVVAQAFHWFDPGRALSELHRVLRPGGRLALVWNLRDTTVDWSRAVGDIANRGDTGTPQVRRGTWRPGLDRNALFTPPTQEEFRLDLPTDHEGVVAWVSSLSHIAAMDPGAREARLDEVRALLRSHPDTGGPGTLVMPFRTELFWMERRSPIPGQDGVVASVQVSPGGVPKRPVDGAWVGVRGLEGDGHTYAGHGGPDAAVCLLAQEAIERVRADGHELFPGAVGENLTLLGVDWASLRPGHRLAFGSGLILELTDFATPCQTIAHWFIERRIARMSQKTHPEDARWYARVVSEGRAEPGDTVRVLTGSEPA